MPFDIEAIERATWAALPPAAVAELPGWLLGLDPGTVGRAHSAVPLAHAAPDLAVVDATEQRYAAQGLRAVWRIPTLPAFEALRTELRQRGYRATQPTCVQIGTTAGMAALPNGGGEGADKSADKGVEVVLATKPSPAWAAVFLGEGFDPVDGAHRVRLLGAAQQAAYASVEVNGQTVAVGTASFSHGWASVHGMRTAQSHRGRGLASAILAALAREAQRRSIDQVFLQVEAGNAKAQALYQRAGFATAWVYEYWRGAAG